MRRDKQKNILSVFKTGKYFCTKDGRVFSRANCHNKPIDKTKTPKEMALQVTKCGYLATTIRYAPGKAYLNTVHQLVFLYFNGPYDHKKTINHKDGNKKNNRLSNLELVTHSENMKHAYRNGLKIAGTGNHSPNHKLTEDIVRKIRKEYKFKNGGELARKYGTTHFNVWCIMKRISWKTI